MSSQLEQLDTRDAILLMYLAGELSADDRAEVDRRLGRDDALRAELDRLRGVDAALVTGFARLDAVTPLPVAPDVAIRNVSRMMRQRLAQSAPAAIDYAPAVGRQLRMPWRAAGLVAAAAMVAVAVMVVPRFTGNGNTNNVSVPTPETERPYRLARIAGESLADGAFEGQADVLPAYDESGTGGRGEDAVASVGVARTVALTDLATPVFDIPLDPGEAQP